MKRNFLLFSVSALLIGVGLPDKPAQASDWGCEVLLCLSNPGSPTEYAECVPPITKLYSHLAKGGSFPTCSGVGFSASKPRYEPYECESGFNLVRVRNEASETVKATCQATAFTELKSHACLHDKDMPSMGKWEVVDGKRLCGYYEQKAPSIREKPNYVDVTIDGSGTQRVWY